MCDVLVRERLLRPDRVESVLGRSQRSGERVEEVILELGLVAEADMLKALATHYKVYFISSEKLSKADVASRRGGHDPAALRREDRHVPA